MVHSILPLLLLAGAGLAQIVIEQPIFTQCESTTLSWSGGEGPYLVYIYPNWNNYIGQAEYYYDKLGPIEETSIPYLVNYPAGKKLRVNVRRQEDIPRAQEFSLVITVGSGNNDSCLASGSTRYDTSTATTLCDPDRPYDRYVRYCQPSTGGAPGPSPTGSPISGSITTPSVNTTSSPEVPVTSASTQSSATSTPGPASTSSPNSVAPPSGAPLIYLIVVLTPVIAFV